MSTIKWFPMDEVNLDADLKSHHVDPDDIISITMTETGGHRVYYRVREDDGFCGDSPYTEEQRESFDIAAAERVYDRFLTDPRFEDLEFLEGHAEEFKEWLSERKRQLRDQHD
jgi:hypothetical protein